MPAAGEMIERSGDGWAEVDVYPFEGGATRVKATIRGNGRVFIWVNQVEPAGPGEARALAAAIVAAAKWAEEREGNGA